MQIQTVTPSNALASRGQDRTRRSKRKLHLPLALTNKPAGPFGQPQGLSSHELRRIVAGMLG